MKNGDMKKNKIKLGMRKSSNKMPKRSGFFIVNVYVFDLSNKKDLFV